MLNKPKRFLTRTKDAIVRLYKCEKGAEGLEKLLIIGAIVLPLLGLLIIFRGRITSWTNDLWGTVKSDTDNYDPDY
jgi:hypothetical protein